MEGIAVGATSSPGPFTLPAAGWGSPGCGTFIKLEERDATGTLKVDKNTLMVYYAICKLTPPQ